MFHIVDESFPNKLFILFFFCIINLKYRTVLFMRQLFQFSIPLIYFHQYPCWRSRHSLSNICPFSSGCVNSFSISLKFPIKEFHWKLCHHLCWWCHLLWIVLLNHVYVLMLILCSFDIACTISVINFMHYACVYMHIVVKHSSNGYLSLGDIIGLFKNKLLTS